MVKSKEWEILILRQDNKLIHLNNLIAGKEVFIKRITKDRYGRTVAELSINGKNIQQIMFNSGYAKIYSKYAYQCAWSR